MGERAQRVYIGKEVVDEGIEGGQGAYLLGREVGWLGRLELCQGVCGVGGRLRGRGFRVDGVEAPLLDGLGMSIGRAAPSAGAIEGAWDLESYTGPTGRA